MLLQEIKHEKAVDGDKTGESDGCDHDERYYCYFDTIDDG